jgi:hypothetical protein
MLLITFAHAAAHAAQLLLLLSLLPVAQATISNR